MQNPGDYEKINPISKGTYVSEREISLVQSCFNKEQKDKEDQCIQNSIINNPDEKNQKRKAIIEIFSYFDRDNSGIINVSDLRYILKTLKIEEKEKSHVDLLIDRAEIEGNGYINYRDFAYHLIK